MGVDSTSGISAGNRPTVPNPAITTTQQIGAGTKDAADNPLGHPTAELPRAASAQSNQAVALGVVVIQNQPPVYSVANQQLVDHNKKPDITAVQPLPGSNEIAPGSTSRVGDRPAIDR